MNPDKIQPQAHNVLAMGLPNALVFDDDALDALLYGSPPVAPTPASVWELWRQGFDRSELCAHALAALLAHDGRKINDLGDLSGAEHCLRLALAAEPSKASSKHAAFLSALGHVMELKKRMEEAEAMYREALAWQDEFLGEDHEMTWITVERLVGLLVALNRSVETAWLSNRFKARQEFHQRTMAADSLKLRDIALNLFMDGHYAKAEAIYRALIGRDFELGSTYCHLARICLMTDRASDARTAVEQAWNVREQSVEYVRCRIHFFQTLLQMLVGDDWKPGLSILKRALAQSGAFNIWTIRPLLDHLKDRLGLEAYELMTAIAAVINRESKIDSLDSNLLWKMWADTSPSEVVGSDVFIPQVSANGDASAPADAEKFSFCILVRITADCLTVREYNFTTDAQEEVEYRLTNQTEISHPTKFNDLRPGDNLVLDYTESNGQRIVSVLIKEIPCDPIE